VRNQARKIYTGTGDVKTTGILGSFRLTKHSIRIESLGSLDELNSNLGFLLSLSDNIFSKSKSKKIASLFREMIQQIQRDLFVIGAELSRPLIKSNTIPHPLRRHYPLSVSFRKNYIPSITHKEIHRIEIAIDHFQERLPPLKNFILPQGHPVGAFLQVVRAICRRTERRIVQLAVHSRINPLALAYLNRLSDLLFVLSRAVNHKSKKAELLWSHSLF